MNNEIQNQLQARGLSHVSDWLDKRLNKATANNELGDIEHVLDWIENEKPAKLEKGKFIEVKNSDKLVNYY